MSRIEPAGAAAGRSRATVLTAVALVSAVLIGLVVDRSSATSGDRSTGMPPAAAGTAPTTKPSRSFPPGTPEQLPRDEQHRLGEADGVVPDGVTVFDDGHPAVTKLDPALLGALRQAAADAARAGVALVVESGWRSPEYQAQLLRQAIAKYGSEHEAARWVATPETSAHISGDAVDIGGSGAMRWLSRHGAEYGLCQIYRNESWHYELRPDARAHGCPSMYVDAAHDPRLQR